MNIVMQMSRGRAWTALLPAALLMALVLLFTGCTDEAEPADATMPADESSATMADAANEPAGASIQMTLAETLRDRDDLSQLAQALDTAGLARTMQEQGPFTLFAPSDAAFEALPPETTTSLLQPERRPQLTNLLTYHVVDGRLPASELRDGQTLTTLAGDTLHVTVANDRIRVGGATVVQRDIRASNGIIHILDQVLTPPGTTL